MGVCPPSLPIRNAHLQAADVSSMRLQVRAAIADILESEENYDDGSLGPVFVRLAWHASGTYDVFSKTGGSNGATMRFHPECDHGANAGVLPVMRRL